MQPTTKVSSVLGISNLETKVLYALVGKPLHSAELTRKVRKPRSSVVDALVRLQKRGLVKVRHIQGRKVWELRDIVNIQSEALSFLTSLQSGGGISAHATLISSPTAEISVQHGTSAIFSWYRTYLKTHAGERLLIMQSTESARMLLKKVPLTDVADFNDEVKKNKIIVNAVVAHSILALSKVQLKEWKESMQGRMSSVAIVPDELLSHSVEMLVFNDLAIVTDWQTEVSILVSHSNIVELFKSMGNALYTMGKRFDANAFLNT